MYVHSESLIGFLWFILFFYISVFSPSTVLVNDINGGGLI